MNISSVEMTTHEIQLLGELLEGRLHFTLGYYNYDEDVYEDNPQSFSLPIALMIQQAPILAGAYARSGFCNDVPGLGPVCIGSQRLPLPFSFRTADPNGNGFVDFIYGQDSKSWAVYGQFTHSLTDRLDLTGGLRYTEDEKSAFLFNENLGQLSFDERLMNAEKWDNLSYLVNLSYDVRRGHPRLCHTFHELQRRQLQRTRPFGYGVCLSGARRAGQRHRCRHQGRLAEQPFAHQHRPVPPTSSTTCRSASSRPAAVAPR